MEIITAITNVFDAIGSWLVGAVGDMIPLFYVAESGLTLLGVLAIASLAVSMSFLLIGIVQKFLGFGA